MEKDAGGEGKLWQHRVTVVWLILGVDKEDSQEDSGEEGHLGVSSPTSCSQDPICSPHYGVVLIHLISLQEGKNPYMYTVNKEATALLTGGKLPAQPMRSALVPVCAMD